MIMNVPRREWSKEHRTAPKPAMQKEKLPAQMLLIRIKEPSSPKIYKSELSQSHPHIPHRLRAHTLKLP
jgi:hypothetical protein